MKKLFFALLLLSATATVLFTSCKKERSTPRPQNNPPRASAGPDQTITLPTDSIEISGSGTDADGNIISYAWRITAYYSQKGQYAYFNFNTPVAQLKALEEGMYWCELTVTDNDGLSAKDEMVVNVVSENCPCYPYPCDAFGDPCNPWDY